MRLSAKLAQLQWILPSEHLSAAKACEREAAEMEARLAQDGFEMEQLAARLGFSRGPHADPTCAAWTSPPMNSGPAVLLTISRITEELERRGVFANEKVSRDHDCE